MATDPATLQATLRRWAREGVDDPVLAAFKMDEAADRLDAAAAVIGETVREANALRTYAAEQAERVTELREVLERVGPLLVAGKWLDWAAADRAREEALRDIAAVLGAG